MNVFTQYYQEYDELAITKSERENQVIANFCICNDINCHFQEIGNGEHRCYVIKGDTTGEAHLQQCRDAISGILYALRVKI